MSTWRLWGLVAVLVGAVVVLAGVNAGLRRRNRAQARAIEGLDEDRRARP